MRVCLFGTYTLEEGYPVNRTILHALETAGIEVVQCRGSLWKKPRRRWGGWPWILSPFFWINFLFVYINLIFKYYFSGSWDLMVIGYLGHQDVFLARLLGLFRKFPIVFVVFNSLYETVVQDRHLFSKGSLAGWILRWVDAAACRQADRLILDTQAHIDYFIREFGLPPDKFLRVFVGSDFAGQAVAEPSRTEGPEFEVLFVGTYIPLHGIETILRAVAILREQDDLKLTLLGYGQSYQEMRRLAQKLKLEQIQFVTRWVSRPELKKHLDRASVCLGIFGDGAKAQNVIPCKVFDYLALGKPVITADTSAARELLRNSENAILVPPGDSEALARAISILKSVPELRRKIAANGRETFLQACGAEETGRTLRKVFQNLIQA